MSATIQFKAYFERFRSRKLNFPAWKSSIIDLEKEESYLFKLLGQMEKLTQKVPKNNLVVKRSSRQRSRSPIKIYSEDVKAKKYKG